MQQPRPQCCSHAYHFEKNEREAATAMGHGVIPVCPLVSSVLVLPSDCVGEPCMVPVGHITTAKLATSSRLQYV